MSAGCKKLVLDGGADDIMCRLPRHVLDKIFERLPIRDAARTSILSRKWRYLWSACPYLVFDQQFYEENIDMKPDAAEKYVNVIDKVLFRHDGSVLNFDLFIPEIFYIRNDEDIDDWLLYLSRNGIQKLSLDYQFIIPYKLPAYVFSSPKLTNLKLVNFIFKPPVSFTGFANLVELTLYNVTFASSAFNGVSHVAPLLESLNFTMCTGITNFTIFAPQASNIVIDRTEVTPVFFEKFPKLIGIVIFIEQGECSPLNLYELHGKYPSIEVLRFDGCFLKLSSAISTGRKLSFMSLVNFRVLSLSVDDLDQISCVLWLLNSSPKMAMFEASVAPSRSTAIETVLAHLESPDCLGKMMCLQMVKLDLFEASKPELAFIKCILAHSPNLERLLIQYRFESFDDNDQQLRISDELLQFPRASDKAKLMVYGP